MKQRCIGLDVYRITLFLIIFMFHSNIHIGCTYGILNDFISVGAVVMSGFFMCSGFVLATIYEGGVQRSDLINWYVKRLIGILPLYYVVAILYSVLINGETWIDWIRLFPIEFLGFQSAFSSLFLVSHNSGTWYISCLLMCYFVFPLINDLVVGSRKFPLTISVIIITLLIAYSPYIVRTYATKDIYSNPFFRILEFSVGIIIYHLSSLSKESEKMSSTLASLISIALFVILVMAVSVAYNITDWGKDYMSYSIITVPVLGLALFVSSKIMFDEAWSVSKIIVFASQLAYPFWMAQFFVWPIMKMIIMPVVYGNISRIVASFIVNVIITFALEYVFNGPLKRMVKKVIQNSNIT